jgi:hypothetical protein
VVAAPVAEQLEKGRLQGRDGCGWRRSCKAAAGVARGGAGPAGAASVVMGRDGADQAAGEALSLPCAYTRQTFSYFFLFYPLSPLTNTTNLIVSNPPSLIRDIITEIKRSSHTN